MGLLVGAGVGLVDGLADGFQNVFGRVLGHAPPAMLLAALRTASMILV